MKIHLQYTAQLRTATGRGDEEFELPEGSCLADLLLRLADHHHDARPHLVTDNGNLRPSLLVVVNNSAVPIRDAGSRRLLPGDVVTLLPPIAGG